MEAGRKGRVRQNKIGREERRKGEDEKGTERERGVKYEAYFNSDVTLKSRCLCWGWRRCYCCCALPLSAVPGTMETTVFFSTEPCSLLLVLCSIVFLFVIATSPVMLLMMVLCMMSPLVAIVFSFS